MKKLACMLIAVFLLTTLVLLTACDDNSMKNAVKNADNYTIVCAYDGENHILSAVQTVEMTNRSSNSFKAVKFHLYPNAYREDAQNAVVPATYKGIAYPNGESWGEITVDGVKAEGNPVAYTVEGEDCDILSVPVEEWFPDEKITVEITYTVSLANIKHRLGWTKNSVNLGNFYPVLCHIENDNYSTSPYYNVGDPFVSEVANYNVTIKVDESYMVASTGNLTEANAENGFVNYNYTADAVRDFALVLSNRYKKLSQTVDDTTINYYYYNDTDSEASLDTAVRAFEYFCRKIGDYPYKQLSVCETDFCYGGMEYPSLVMITSGSKSYREAIVHETAHQWFYATVGNNQIEDAWMDEGLAEFLTYLYLDNCDDTPLSQNILANIKTYTTYVDVLNNYYDNVDITYRSLDKYKNDNEYVIMTYIKGSLMFNTLYETMGESKFFKALGDYYKHYSFQIATPAQMSDCFSKTGGAELSTIFSNYAEGKEIVGKVTD